MTVMLPSLLRRAFVLVLALLPVAAQTHPHIFVDTTLRLVTDDSGRISGVEVVWTYDELFSLLILEDMGLDSDYDGVLTPPELAQLQGFDMNWIEGYHGDLFASRNGDDLTLGPPQPRSTEFGDGKITSVHFRTISAPGDKVTLRAFDPTFYTAYDLTGGVAAPDGCEVRINRPDLDAAYAAVEEKLEDMPPDPEDYPPVGDLFADTVIVTCD